MPKKTVNWDLLNNNSKLIALLGFDASNLGCWICQRVKAKDETQYRKCNLSQQIVMDKNWNQIRRTSLSALLGSNIGKEPVFGSFRKYSRPQMKKRGNVISKIRHPDMWGYDFDNHEKSAALSQKTQEIYARLYQFPELLIGYSEGFNGLHVFCLSSYKCIVEQECEEFKKAGGHIDIFNSKKGNGIGIPGFDHYLYKKDDVSRFIDLLNVEITGWLSIYNDKYSQKIKYPEPVIIDQIRLEEQKLYKNSKANVKMHLEGIKNCVIKCKQNGSENAFEYINSLMLDEGHRTPRLLSKQEAKQIIWALANLNIQDIEEFRYRFPDFEENHYKLIEERLEYINENRKEASKGKSNNSSYIKKIKELKILIEKLFVDSGIKYNKRLLSVATYLTNCKDIKCTPGYIHYIEFCKMNNEEPVKERSYYDKVNECEEKGLIVIPNKKLYSVGKICRTIVKGHLLHILDYQRSRTIVSKAFNYIEANIIYNNNNINKISLPSIITCTAKNIKTHIFEMFDMKDFYSLMA